MGKGKRLKKQKQALAHEAAIFERANEMSRLPEYTQEDFEREFELSGHSFDVYRKWIYLSLRLNPDNNDELAEEAIRASLKQSNLAVNSDGCVYIRKADHHGEEA